jgi:hypothetical protein
MVTAGKLLIRGIICTAIFMQSESKKNLTNSEFKGNCKIVNNICHNNQFDIRYINPWPFICNAVEREAALIVSIFPVMWLIPNIY